MSQTAVAQTGLSEFDTPQAWYGPETAERTDWIHTLSDSDRRELRSAISVAQASGRPLHELAREQFPLGGLAARLHRLRREALDGRGFFLLRGVPVAEYSPWENAAAFWGIGLYLGEAVSQNGKGHVLGHVANLGLDYADPEVRGYQTNAGLNFHTDFSDLVGLLCLRTPQSGGLSRIASSTTIWNEMVRRRPDLARILLEPVHYTRWGEVGAGMKPYYGMPVFSPCAGRMVVTYVRSGIRKAQLMPEVPRLSPLQEEALDLLDSLAADPAMYLSMEFRPGDIQILCNHWITHSRTSYIDWPEPARRRHLLRLWLACDGGPAVPSSFTAVAQPATRSGRPAGIQVPGVPFSAPLIPC
jgi:Taurine catabolism dioxygenase TauD, TfdA family